MIKNSSLLHQFYSCSFSTLFNFNYRYFPTKCHSQLPNLELFLDKNDLFFEGKKRRKKFLVSFQRRKYVTFKQSKNVFLVICFLERCKFIFFFGKNKVFPSTQIHTLILAKVLPLLSFHTKKIFCSMKSLKWKTCKSNLLLLVYTLLEYGKSFHFMFLF